MRWLVALLVMAICSTAYSQLDVKSQYELGEPIIVKMKLEGKPEGAVLRKDKFKISVKPTAEFQLGVTPTQDAVTPIKVDDSTWHVWVKPGKYVIEASGEWRLYQDIESKDGKIYKVIADEDDYEFTASFEVMGGEGDDPVPPPPPPPVPGSKWGLLLRETKGGQSPALGNLLIQLREKLPTNKLVIHDPTTVPDRLKSLIPSVTPPVLMVLARQADGTDKLVKAVSVSDTTTVADVEKELK